MHQDAPSAEAADDAKLWEAYIGQLRSTGQFDGGSSIGQGECVSKEKSMEVNANGVGGFIRIRAVSLEDAKRFLVGNPVYEAGGTVEIRELIRT